MQEGIYQFCEVFVAGTFDGLHAGHRAVLSRAFLQGERVTIGLTSDEFVKKCKVQSAKCKVRRYEERRKELYDWLGEKTARATIIPIDDPYEPAVSMRDLDALVVTAENRKRGEEINQMRRSRGLAPLELIDVPMVPAEDGRPISSTRLRNGEIDADGRLVMPESLRGELRKPLGKVFKRPPLAGQGEALIVTVGDVATKTFLDAGIQPFLAIIDGKVGRKPYPQVVDQLRKTTSCEATTVKSGPGFMSCEAIEAIRAAFSRNSPQPPLTLRGGEGGVIVVNGEEDLLVLPAVIHAPIGAIVYYGQPREGLVEVRVTQAKKRHALALLRKFA